MRSPALVSAEFRARIAARVVPLGFVARAQNKALVRKQGKNVHRISFASSHYNTPGDVAAFVHLDYVDAETRRLEAGWRAGGQVGDPTFSAPLRTNVADSEQADRLADAIAREVGFFDQFESPPAIASEVMRRYVPGLVDPEVVAPYLRAHLGEEVVISYADALLAGRPELAPAFVTAIASEHEDPQLRDHGTQLARSVRQHGARRYPAVSPDTVRSTKGRGLRCFFGRQLRAWGEPEAAHALRTVGDEELLRVHDAQKAIETPLVDSSAAARLALALALGVDRAPRRSRSSPRLFQYYALHEPFSMPPGP